jgi:hypothetical protein
MEVVSFFTNSKNVWVSENFQNIILSGYADTNKNKNEQSISSSDLRTIETGAVVEELAFKDTDDFLEKLAILIQSQVNGENGKLLNDSSANQFFLKAKDGKYYSILVRWEQAQKLWRCGAYLQENPKMPNVRIFYPTK